MSELHETSTAGHSRTETFPNGQTSLSERVRSLRLTAGGPASRPRSAWLPWGLTIIALATAAVFGWRAYRLTPADVAQLPEQGTVTSEVRAPAAPGAVAPTTTAPGEVVLDAKGYIIAAHQIQLSPQVGGEITWLDPNFKEGAFYKKGDRLAELDPIIYAAKLKSAQASLRVAEVNLKQVETGSTLKEITAAKATLLSLAARLELSRIDERTKFLAGPGTSREEKAKATVQKALDQAAHDAQKETLAKVEVALEEQRLIARANVLKAQADVEEAEKQVQNCTILAPTTGIVLSKKTELGGYVNPQAFGAAGFLCEMADLRDLEVELDIQERDINRVKPGQRCRIMPEAGQRDEDFLKTHPEGYLGSVSRRMPVANRSKGAITVRVKVEVPAQEKSGEHLLPDMGVMVWFFKEDK